MDATWWEKRARRRYRELIQERQRADVLRGRLARVRELLAAWETGANESTCGECDRAEMLRAALHSAID